MLNFLLGSDKKMSSIGIVGAFLIFAGEYLSSNSVVTLRSFVSALAVFLLGRVGASEKTGE